MATRNGASDEVFVVLAGFATWESFAALLHDPNADTLTLQPKIVTPHNSIGFVPVYATREDAQKVVDALGRPAYIAAMKRG